MTVTTPKFVALARAESQTLGLPTLRLELVPHPFAGLDVDEARSRGTEVGDAIVRYLSQDD